MAFHSADLSSPHYHHYSSSSRSAGRNPPDVLPSIEPEGDPLVALQTSTRVDPRVVRLLMDELLGFEEELDKQVETITFIERDLQERKAHTNGLRDNIARVKSLVDTLLVVVEARTPSSSLSPPSRRRKREAELLGPIDPEAGRGGKRMCNVGTNYKV